MLRFLLADNGIGQWQSVIVTAIQNVLGPLLIVACSAGMVYAIVIGIKMIRAEDKAAREENKARLINIAIAIVAVLVMIGIFYALASWLDGKTVDDVTGGITTSSISNTVKTFTSRWL